MNEEKILEIYPEFDTIKENKRSKDGRIRVTLSNSKTKITTTKQKAKLVLESKLERRLTENETVDHIDNDKTNDDVSNLQILSREENARKGALGNTHCLGYKQSEDVKRKGTKNGMSKLTEEQVLNARISYKNKEKTKAQLMEELNMSDKGLRNVLFGISYSNVGEICLPSKIGRPKSTE